jgi:hypothetical protein
MIRLSTILLLFLVVGCGQNKGPVGPSETPPVITSVEVKPAFTFMGVGETVVFNASGGDGQNYRWSVSGGAEIVSATGNACEVRGNGPAGAYLLRAESGGQTGEAKFEVATETKIAILNIFPPEGNISFGTPIEFVVAYHFAEPIPPEAVYTLLNVWFFDEKGEKVGSSSTSATIKQTGTGVANTRTTVPALPPPWPNPPKTVKFFRIEFGWIAAHPRDGQGVLWKSELIPTNYYIS